MKTYKVKIPTITINSQRNLTHAQAVKELAKFLLSLGNDDEILTQEIEVNGKTDDGCDHGFYGQDCYDCYPRSGAV